MMFTESHKELLENNPIAVSTVDKDGSPNVIAIAYAKVFPENKIVITDNFMRQTIDNVQDNGKMCLAAWDKEWNGIKILGSAQYYTEGRWTEFVKGLEENKDMSAKGAILFEGERIIDLK